MQRAFGTILLALSAAVLPGTPAAAGDIQTDGAFVSTATSGPPLVVSSSDLVTNLNADMVDGLHSADLATKLGNVVTVAATGGDFTSISGANDSITDASASNPYLVEIGPGSFFIQSSFTAKSHVHYRGSGQGVTTLQLIAAFGGGSGQIAAQSNTQISDLTIGNTLDVTSLSLDGATGVDIVRTTISHPSAGSTDFNPVEILNDSSAELQDVSLFVTASGGPKIRGIRIADSTVQLREIRLSIETNGGGVRGIQIEDSSSVAIDGGAFTLASVGTGGANIAVWADGSAATGIPAATVDRVWIDASGSNADNRGVNAKGAVVEVAQSSLIIDSGGNQARGFRGNATDDATRITVRDCAIQLSGGGTEIGVEGFGTSTSETITVFDSQIDAAGNVASAGSNWTINLIRSHLAGGAMGGSGTIDCRYSTDESFTALDTACPS